MLNGHSKVDYNASFWFMLIFRTELELELGCLRKAQADKYIETKTENKRDSLAMHQRIMLKVSFDTHTGGSSSSGNSRSASRWSHRGRHERTGCLVGWNSLGKSVMTGRSPIHSLNSSSSKGMS